MNRRILLHTDYPSTDEDVTYYAKLVLIVNTAGSMQDLYNVIRLFRLPGEAVFLNVDDGKIRTFYSLRNDESTAEP